MEPQFLGLQKGREVFLRVAPPDCNAAKLRNREFSIAVNGTSGRIRDNVCPIDLRVLVI